MTQPFNNQVMLGRREWAILANNNTPIPVGPDNKPLVDKPLQVEGKRRPSEVDQDYKDDENVVGYMGDDEDIEQAKYDVMSLISDKIGHLDNRIERISNDITGLIQANHDDIDELRGEINTELCVPFLMLPIMDDDSVWVLQMTYVGTMLENNILGNWLLLIMDYFFVK